MELQSITIAGINLQADDSSTVPGVLNGRGSRLL